MSCFIKIKVCPAETQLEKVRGSVPLNKIMFVSVDRLIERDRNPDKVIFKIFKV